MGISITHNCSCSLNRTTKINPFLSSDSNLADPVAALELIFTIEFLKAQVLEIFLPTPADFATNLKSTHPLLSSR